MASFSNIPLFVSVNSVLDFHTRSQVTSDGRGVEALIAATTFRFLGSLELATIVLDMSMVSLFPSSVKVPNRFTSVPSMVESI